MAEIDHDAAIAHARKMACDCRFCNYVADLAERANDRDKDWILAIGHALGLDSGHEIPIVPEVEPFRRLFASVGAERAKRLEEAAQAAKEYCEARFADARARDRVLELLENALAMTTDEIKNSGNFTMTGVKIEHSSDAGFYYMHTTDEIKALADKLARRSISAETLDGAAAALRQLAEERALGDPVAMRRAIDQAEELLENAGRPEGELLATGIAAILEERDCDDRVLRASVPDRWKGCASPVGAAQSYISELEQIVMMQAGTASEDIIDELAARLAREEEAK